MLGKSLLERFSFFRVTFGLVFVTFLFSPDEEETRPTRGLPGLLPPG